MVSTEEKKTYNSLNFSKLSQNLKNNIARRKAAKHYKDQEQAHIDDEDTTSQSNQQ
jgi:hypothetical protein